MQDVGSESSGPKFPPGFECVNKVPLDLMFVEVQTEVKPQSKREYEITLKMEFMFMRCLSDQA